MQPAQTNRKRDTSLATCFETNSRTNWTWLTILFMFMLWVISMKSQIHNLIWFQFSILAFEAKLKYFTGNYQPACCWCATDVCLFYIHITLFMAEVMLSHTFSVQHNVYELRQHFSIYFYINCTLCKSVCCADVII